MELLKSALLAVWYIIAALMGIVFVLNLMFIIDVYVLGWLGLPTDRGIGVGIVIGLIIFGVITAAVHFHRMLDKELNERKEERQERSRRLLDH